MAKKFDLYETVTDTIVTALESGIAPWVKPWRNQGAHRNGSSGRPYNGINTLLLEIAALGGGWEHRDWYTYKGATEKGGQVKSGSKGTLVVFWQIIRKKDTDETFPLLRYYKVFNRGQIDGLPEVKPVTGGCEFVPAERSEAFIQGTGARISYGGDRACYSPLTDEIRVPKPESFNSPAAFYATTFHELVHWSGHTSRLGRKFGIRGGEDYAFEELIAELGAAFLCEINGVDGMLQHPEYIGSWLKVLKNDKKFIFSAASAARKAVEFMTRSEVEEDGAE